MTTKASKLPCNIGCCKECTSECSYHASDSKCAYYDTVGQYKSKVLLSADNGFSGSVVLIEPSTLHIVHIELYPSAKRLYQVLVDFRPINATIEQVFMAPGFRGVASSNFEIMGRYMQTFELLDIPYETVRAVSWRKTLGIKAKGRPAQKAASIERAKELFSAEDFDKLCTNYTRIDKTLHKKVTERWPDDNKCESALIGVHAAYKLREQNAKEAN